MITTGQLFIGLTFVLGVMAAPPTHHQSAAALTAAGRAPKDEFDPAASSASSTSSMAEDFSSANTMSWYQATKKSNEVGSANDVHLSENPSRIHHSLSALLSPDDHSAPSLSHPIQQTQQPYHSRSSRFGGVSPASSSLLTSALHSTHPSSYAPTSSLHDLWGGRSYPSFNDQNVVIGASPVIYGFHENSGTRRSLNPRSPVIVPADDGPVLPSIMGRHHLSPLVSGERNSIAGSISRPSGVSSALVGVDSETKEYPGNTLYASVPAYSSKDFSYLSAPKPVQASGKNSSPLVSRYFSAMQNKPSGLTGSPRSGSPLSQPIYEDDEIFGQGMEMEPSAMSSSNKLYSIVSGSQSPSKTWLDDNGVRHSIHDSIRKKSDELSVEDYYRHLRPSSSSVKRMGQIPSM